MYQRTVFETAKEFFDACVTTLPSPISQPVHVPTSVYVVFDDGELRLSGDASELFEFNGITREQLISEAFARSDSSIHFT